MQPWWGEGLAEEVKGKLKLEGRMRLTRIRWRKSFQGEVTECISNRHYMPKWAEGILKAQKLYLTAEDRNWRAGRQEFT